MVDAIATYVQAKPTIRTNILTTCFIIDLLALRLPWERETHATGL